MPLGAASRQGWSALLSTHPGLIKEGEPRGAYCQQCSKESQGVEGRNWQKQERLSKWRGIVFLGGIEGSDGFRVSKPVAISRVNKYYKFILH